ncbi:MAG: hypothetical protein WA139_05995 [Candidatus Aenigmatarchaeota archaeon]
MSLLDSITDNLGLGFLLLVIVLFASMEKYPLALASLNNASISVSGIFLAFISIFYSLILAKKFKQKRETMFIQNLNDFLQKITEKVDLIKRLIPVKDNSEKFYNKNEIFKVLDKIAEDTQSFSSRIKEIDAENYLFKAFLFFSISIIMSLISPLLKALWQYPLIDVIVLILLLCGINNSFSLVNLWRKLNI